jgi:hypothetical protein
VKRSKGPQVSKGDFREIMKIIISLTYFPNVVGEVCMP